MVLVSDTFDQVWLKFIQVCKSYGIFYDFWSLTGNDPLMTFDLKDSFNSKAPTNAC